MTVFLVGGYLTAEFTGEMTSSGFEPARGSALIQFVAIVAYLCLGRERLGGTIWQRNLKAK